MSFIYWTTATRENVAVKTVLKSTFGARDGFYVVVDLQGSLALCTELEKVFDDNYNQVYSEASLKEATGRDKRTNYSFNLRFDADGFLRSGSDCFYVQTTTCQPVSTKAFSSEKFFCRLCATGNVGTMRKGPLAYFGNDADAHDKYWMHAYCFACSSRTADEVVDSFISRCRKLTCTHCKSGGASIGCHNTKCRQNFHLACAEYYDAEYVPETGRLYCPKHAEELCLENRIAVNYPANSEAYYGRQSLWHAISSADRKTIALFAENYQTTQAFWFTRIFSCFVRVKEIFQGHCAFSTQYAQVGKPQYEVVAATDISVGEIVGEYVGEVFYADDQSKESDYCAILLMPDALMARVPPMIIDSRRYGNEMRYINSVAPWTPPEIKENVELVTYMYNGQPRILVLATNDIASGESLWLNYGKDFFADDK